MIIDPDFLDHWKTRLLVDLLEDDSAPLYVIRIWSLCQLRHTSRFEGMSTRGLKAMCHYRGDADRLESALIETGYVARDGAAIVVPKWDDYNRALRSRWENGAKGGRANGTGGEPNGNRTGTEQEPADNRTGTEQEPADNRRVTGGEAIGLGIREDKNKNPPNPPSGGNGRKANRKSAEAEASDAFNRFWAAWPKHQRKVNRDGCVRKWNADQLDDHMGEILRAVEFDRKSEAWTKDGGQFIPAPLVWLNQGRWKNLGDRLVRKVDPFEEEWAKIRANAITDEEYRKLKGWKFFSDVPFDPPPSSKGDFSVFEAWTNRITRLQAEREHELQTQEQRDAFVREQNEIAKTWKKGDQ